MAVENGVTIPQVIINTPVIEPDVMKSKPYICFEIESMRHGERYGPDSITPDILSEIGESCNKDESLDMFPYVGRALENVVFEQTNPMSIPQRVQLRERIASTVKKLSHSSNRILIKS